LGSWLSRHNATLDLDTGSFKTSERENRLSNLHRDGFPPAWSTSQDGNDFTGQKTQLGQAAHNTRFTARTRWLNQGEDGCAAAGRHLIDGIADCGRCDRLQWPG